MRPVSGARACARLAVLLAVAVAGCGTTPEDGAAAAAEQAARARIDGLRQSFAILLKADSTNAQAVTEMTIGLRAANNAYPGGSYRTFVITSSSDATMGTITVAMYGHGEGAKDGDPFHQSTVVLCVSLTGRVGPEPRVESTQVTCPATPPSGAPPTADLTLSPSASPG